jgi:hypothetical protein
MSSCCGFKAKPQTATEKSRAKSPVHGSFLDPISNNFFLGCIILTASKLLDLPKTLSKLGGQIKLTGNEQGDMGTAIAFAAFIGSSNRRCHVCFLFILGAIDSFGFSRLNNFKGKTVAKKFEVRTVTFSGPGFPSQYATRKGRCKLTTCPISHNATDFRGYLE